MRDNLRHHRFELFTFACSPNQHTFYEPIHMDDDISPTSSNTSTPCCDPASNDASRRFSTSTSISELSQQFNHHTISSRKPSISRDIPTIRLNAQNQSYPSPIQPRLVSSRRQSLVRRQYSAAHLSRIASMVSHVSDSAYGSPASATPSDSTASPSLSSDEASPPAFSYFKIVPRPSVSSTLDASTLNTSHTRPRTDSYKISKELRHSISRDTLGAQEKVMKPIRMRRRARESSGTLEKKR